MYLIRALQYAKKGLRVEENNCRRELTTWWTRRGEDDKNRNLLLLRRRCHNALSRKNQCEARKDR